MQQFLPIINKEDFDRIKESNIKGALFSLLVAPLHEELNRRQTFDFLEDLSNGQKLFLSFDYVKDQVFQGGFIQLLANGYVGLLPEMPAWLTMMMANEMAQLIDDVLKSYVEKVSFFKDELSTQAFAQLYSELPEFDLLEKRFHSCYDPTINAMEKYAIDNLNLFMIT
ncbi:MAG: DUF4375 domain-containing protein [Bacteroidetes bacterium]|nr:DUF4375 domain-containing protein [Bacteroidota bacterium]MBS1739941.1 DUF4375 domain-containing protein [Bacteroidota bacterium]